MSYTFRPAKREHTPLILGIAGPTKSGKTKSAHRLARGLAQGAPIAMINTEGAKGHQYSDQYEYLCVDIEAPFRPEKYTEALQAALALKPRPAVVIIDSLSHMHNGPGGILAWHESELDRMAGNDHKKRERSTWTAWIKPKAAENQFVYSMLSADCHLILCFRAKEKLKIVRGQEPIELGWQPIAGEAVSFETIFTLVLPPNSKGVPDLSLSEMREPFDMIIPAGAQLSEDTGKALAHWAVGASAADFVAAGAHPEIPVLAGQLLDLAEKLGRHDATKTAIDKHAGDAAPGAHAQWLVRQIANAGEAVAELEKATAVMSGEENLFASAGPDEPTPPTQED